MNSLQRYTCKATIIGLCLAFASGAYAQVSSINSAIIVPRVFNDIPLATFTPVNSYPGSISFTEANVSSATGYANRDVWYFSNNGGASAYQFQNNDYFNASMSVQLFGGDPGYDLEAGWLFSNPSGSFGGDLQSLITAAGVVVQFGGPSYYPFSPAAGGYPGAGGSVPNYTESQIYILGINYVVDPNTGNNAFQYSVNGQWAASSPGNTYFDLGPGVGVGSNPLGGYFQIQQNPNDPSNTGSVIFDDITITRCPGTFHACFLGSGHGDALVASSEHLNSTPPHGNALSVVLAETVLEGGQSGAGGHPPAPIFSAASYIDRLFSLNGQALATGRGFSIAGLELA